MKKRLVFFVTLMSCAISQMAQTNIIPVSSGEILPDGITYRLPLTTLVINVEAVQTIEKPGPFYKYTERFLGTTDFISESKREWTLKDVGLRYRMDGDSSKCYHIAINKKTTASNIQLNEKGVILSVNQPVHSKTHAPKPLSLVVSDTVIQFDLSQLGEEALVSSSIPKMAEIAAKQIYRIRESRTNLLSGDNEHLPDGVSLTLMLQKLDDAERELVALFVGKRVSIPASCKFYVTPSEELTNHIVFRMSTLAGIVEPDNLLGRPIYLSVKPCMVTAHPVITNSKKMCGHYYNVPGSADVVITDNVTVLAQKTFIMPQFGTVAYLPTVMFDGVVTKVEFTNFGTIKSISK